MLATRGGSRTPGLYHNSDRSEGSAEQRVLSGAPHRITTRVVTPRGWHTNRGSWRAILVSHLAILCRDPKRLRAVLELRHEEGADHNGLGQRLDTTFLRARAAASSSCDTRRVPTKTTIQAEAQDRVTGGFSNGRVPYTGLDTTASQACERLTPLPI